MSKVVKALTSTFGKTIIIEDRDPERTIVRVPKESIIEVALWSKESLGFDHAISVSIIDNLAGNNLVISYHLSSVGNPQLHGQILTLEVVTDRNSPQTPSLVEIWSSVEFHEREGWELFGIEFEGHPKLERLLLPESWEEGYPLRKDYKLRGVSE